MNFIRPEVREGLWRWSEVIAYGMLILWGLWLIGFGLVRGSMLQAFIGAAITVLFAVLTFWAILRVKMYKPLKRSGVVVVKEREVGYLSPDGGALISLDDLTKLEIIASRVGSAEEVAFWVLSHAGAPLSIPADAKGSELLFDAFAALKGVDFEEAARAMTSKENARFLIWEKQRLH